MPRISQVVRSVKLGASQYGNFPDERYRGMLSRPTSRVYNLGILSKRQPRSPQAEDSLYFHDHDPFSGLFRIQTYHHSCISLHEEGFASTVRPPQPTTNSLTTRKSLVLLRRLQVSEDWVRVNNFLLAEPIALVPRRPPRCVVVGHQ